MRVAYYYHQPQRLRRDDPNNNPYGTLLCEALERADHLAVDDAGRQRIDLTGNGGHRSFVEQLDARRHIALQNQAPRLGDASERGRRGLVNRPDVDRATSPLSRALEVAG